MTRHHVAALRREALITIENTTQSRRLRKIIEALRSRSYEYRPGADAFIWAGKFSLTIAQNFYKLIDIFLTVRIFFRKAVKP